VFPHFDVDEIERRLTATIEGIVGSADAEHWDASRSYRTRLVKEAFREVAHQLSFSVCASGCRGGMSRRLLKL
jgi:hypothetical protein